jgi:poly(A) polymerase
MSPTEEQTLEERKAAEEPPPPEELSPDPKKSFAEDAYEEVAEYEEEAGDGPEPGERERDLVVLPRPEHPISRKLIDPNAIKVLYRLKNQGYKGYLCGGAVRDLMMERQPKDFDVCTDAEPRDLRRLFRNARIIGRRFRLAHVLFKEGIIEVATFRRAPDPQEQDRDPGELLITDDNVFGTAREDAFRRDFTINALFYNVEDFSVLDYVGGIEDLERGLIRVIGDPDLRFREDPVRMMRACEFAGRLGFTIEPETQEAIQRQRDELAKAAPPRLTEELLQLLRCGSAGGAIQWMLELGLLEVLLPEAMAMIEARQRGAGSFNGILPTLDRMSQEGKELSDPVLLGAVLLPQIMLRRYELERGRGRWMKIGEFKEVVAETVEPFLERFSVANFKRAHMVQALEGFHRLCSHGWTPGQRIRFATKSYFDDALQLFEILVLATGEGHEALEPWEEAKKKRPRRSEPKADKRGPRRRGRRRRRRR